MSFVTALMLVSSQKSLTPAAACCESISVSMKLVSSTSPSSFTVTTVVPAVAPTAEAVMVEVLLPSGKLSLTAVTSKDAEADPFGMVTDAGTVASVASLEERLTTKALVVAPVRVTVPAAAGLLALSEKVEGVTTTERNTAGAGAPKPL